MMTIQLCTMFHGIVIFAVFSLSCAQYPETDVFQTTLGHLKSQVTTKDQKAAAEAVVARLLGNDSELFDISVDPNLGPAGKDTFQVINHLLPPYDILQIRKGLGGKTKISGTSGVAVTWGFHYYLKKYCNSHVSWEGAQLNLEACVPAVNVIVSSNDRFRYYQNVCTPGYSFAWWKWDQWEKHIDWMALNGINLALAFTGQEAIWERVYHELNLTNDEIMQHFGGPAFLPWTRMGNIRGWGGPLSPSWHRHTINLQHSILKRMRELGMIPVLPAFAGHVPRGFARLFPHANLTKINTWNNFEDRYCCPYLLSPIDPLFHTIGQKFLTAYINEFGTNHVYNCDTFNENMPTQSSIEYLRNVGQSTYSAMQSVDPNAIWLMQGWLFVHDIIFWTNERVKALVTSVPIGKMIILDLQSEQWPQYGRLRSYYGQPFIWCMLHNFGGTLGMFGSAEIINKRVFEARSMNGSTMIGTGLTPEGINQNYVIYELMNEMAYNKEPVVLLNWFQDYAIRRYGTLDANITLAWQILSQTVYNFSGWQRIRGHYVITRRPSLKISTWVWYNRRSFFQSWNMFVRPAENYRNNSLYKHDLVDITRQGLQLIADDIYKLIVISYNAKNFNMLRTTSAQLLKVFDDLEEILASGEHFLLGTWLKDAKALATNAKEEEHYIYNARNQITLWGPHGEIVDYANKQWSGVIVDYFKPRWALFLDALKRSVVYNETLNMSQIKKRIFSEVEKPFTLSKKMYPILPKGDSVDIARRIFYRWMSFYQDKC